LELKRKTSVRNSNAEILPNARQERIELVRGQDSHKLRAEKKRVQRNGIAAGRTLPCGQLWVR
jgi:hypothetical protein